jgi:hypothetical protein
MDPTATETVEAYYGTLSSGESLAPFFAERSDLVKFGISERLEGFPEVERGLREQTETTTDWSVESRSLIVREADRCAWFSDEVRMGWTDLETEERREFDTRWSGMLRRDDRWRFVGLHVSVPREF